MSLREAESEPQVEEEFDCDDPLVAMMEVAVTSGDMLQFHLIDTMMKRAAQARKEQNSKLIELEKTWKRMKEASEASMIRKLEAEGECSASNRKARKIKTLLGTSFLRHNAAKVSLREEMLYDESGDTLSRPVAKLFAFEDFFEGDANYETVTRLTHEGKEKLKAWALKQAEGNGEEVAWAQVTPPGPSVATRLSSAGVVLEDPAYVGNLKRIMAIEASRREASE